MPLPESLDATLTSLVQDLEERFPYAAALYGETSGVELQQTNAEQHASELSPTRGVTLTIYDGRSFQEMATSDLAPDHLVGEVRAWAAALHTRSGGPPLPPSPLSPDDARQSFAVPFERDPTHVSLEEKLALLRQVHARTRGIDDRIVQAQVAYRDETRETVYIGRGRHFEQRLTRTSLHAFVVMVEKGQTGWHSFQRGGLGGYELAHISGEELAQTVETALRLTRAGRVEPGEYTIVADSSISGGLAHESFGHGVELDLFPKGRARAAKYLNRQVAARHVQIYDDPTLPGAYGSYYFDDEGELARPTQIVRDGIFETPLSDLASATYTDGGRTANGRRQDYTRKVYARMSNTYFGPGREDPRALIAAVDHGIYLRQMEHGIEDPMGWGIQVVAHYGEEIEHGRLTGRLFAPIVITGYVPDLLQSIDAVGNDLEVLPGICGKGVKEWVPVSVGGPHLRLKARLS